VHEPAEKDGLRNAWGRVAEVYAGMWAERTAHVTAQGLDLLAPEAGASGVDVACGPGLTTAALAERLGGGRALGVDFAILGAEEKCAGECARLVGEKGLFDSLREQNMATFGKYEYASLLTSDPHAFDAFAYVYPQLGLDRPVHHTTPFVADHLDDLKPRLTRELGYKVTYHDSCVLGRHNHMHDEPRRILEALPGVSLVEMTHNRDNTICCGGGGGGMWLDTHYKAKGHPRLSDRRVEEAAATGADISGFAVRVSRDASISRPEGD